MTPEQYDYWYRTPRGRWIGEIEFRLICALLEPQPAARILDVGCGTGYFTRRAARPSAASSPRWRAVSLMTVATAMTSPQRHARRKRPAKFERHLVVIGAT
ncbi:MAG: hypothetical protein WCA09_07935 [Burkholderiales bacterium]